MNYNSPRVSRESSPSLDHLATASLDFDDNDYDDSTDVQMFRSTRVSHVPFVNSDDF